MQIKLPHHKKVFQKTNPNNKAYYFWMFLLGMMLAAMALSCVFGYFLFKKVSMDAALSSEEAGQEVDTVSMSRLENALKYFKSKEDRSAEARNTNAPFVDPSL